jgi:prophage regulatory protein
MSTKSGTASSACATDADHFCPYQGHRISHQSEPADPHGTKRSTRRSPQYAKHDHPSPSRRKTRTGLSRSTIYQRMTEGHFPKPISIGLRAVGWLESEIEEWVTLRIEKSRQSTVAVATSGLRVADSRAGPMRRIAETVLPEAATGGKRSARS